MLNHRDIFSIIPQSDYLRMPWKNGLGETLEIAVSRENNEVQYRVSQAAVVEDGLFSDFSGLHRTLILLQGQGMLLTHQNGEKTSSHELKQPLSMAKFAGGDVTHASLTDGKIEDLNIMVREGKVTSRVEAVFSPASFMAEHTDSTLFSAFYANSDCVLAIESKSARQEIHLKSQDTVRFHQPVNTTLLNGMGVKISIM
ncbi:HutD/Ves family protein [Vibrio sp. YIC-376]|uniref:HutD/Ves family protein n=1 Tax=Vibrio sp. YIC-376 TaxID=3136162 RepID=UPI00402ADDE6